MAMQHLPFLCIRGAGLIEQGDRHLELADVVQQRRPAQPRLPGFIDLQLVGDEVGEDPHALGMPAGRLVVDAQREHKLDDRLHALSVVLAAARTGVDKLLLELPRTAGPARHRESSRRLVWKQERDVQQSRKRQQAAGRALEDDQRQERPEGDDDDPEDGGEGARCAGRKAD